MKILYLHQYFVPPDSAGGTRSYEMGRRLVEMGHEVDLVTSTAYFGPRYSFSKPITKMEIDGIRLIVLDVPYDNKMSFHCRILAFVGFVIASSLVSTRFKPDIVFATSTPLTIGVPGLVAKYYRNIPLVFEVRDLWPELPIAVGALKSKPAIYIARCLEKFTYDKSKHIVALSPDMKAGIVKSGIHESKVSVIPNSCDLELFDVPIESGIRFREQYPQTSSRSWVVYAGAFGLINGVSYLIEMANVMNQINPEVAFVFFGRGAEEEKIRKKAQEYGLIGKNVFFMPQIPKLEMPNLLSAATISSSVFLPIEAMWANSANKFFDSLASGTPVMINYYGWQAEILQEYRAGFVVSPYSPERAAKTLARKLDNLSELEQMGKQAKKLAKERFDRNALAKQLEEVLRRALAN